MTGVDGRDSGHSMLCDMVRWSGWHLMLLSDGWVSRWVASSICRGVASSEAEFPPSRGPAEGSTEGISNGAESAYFPRVGPIPSSVAELWCALEASEGRPRVRRRLFCGSEGTLG